MHCIRSSEAEQISRGCVTINTSRRKLLSETCISLASLLENRKLNCIKFRGRTNLGGVVSTINMSRYEIPV